MTNPTDKLGHEFQVGDLVAFPALIGPKPVIHTGVVAELNIEFALIVVEGANEHELAMWADEAIRLERDPDAEVEQFLPIGTTFDAKYADGHGTYEFTVMADGRIRDNEGDESTMETILLPSICHVARPVWKL